MLKRIQVFEHDTLAIGEHSFNSRQFSALVRYNDRHDCAYFKVGHNRLHFGSFVGVIQVGNLAIEILPKLENEASANKGKWQGALLQMLHQSGLVIIEPAPDADLKLCKSPLMDVYLTSFLAEVQHLAHVGLLKRYRLTEGNLYKLKGRIQFSQQLRRNLLHRERMFTAHQVYDRDNAFNRILKCALTIMERLSIRPSLASRAGAFLLWFEEVADARVTADTFKRLTFDRNAERYRRAIQLARLIILNYSPDLCGGHEHVVAILFDMNRLFERFILVQLRRVEPLYADLSLRVTSQLSELFWSTKTIRPDVRVNFKRDTVKTSVVLDTKWKVPNDCQPSDPDLKQMYVYNLQFGGNRGILIYPRATANQKGKEKPFASSVSFPAHSHNCATYYIDLFDPTNRLRKDIGIELIENVILPGDPATAVA